MIPFFIAFIVLATVLVIIWPLVTRNETVKAAAPPEDTELGEVLARRDAALLAISEIESDYEMGNLSEKDYTEIRRKYDEQAVTLLRSIDELRSERTIEAERYLDREIEERVARLRGNGGSRQVPEGRTCADCEAPVPVDGTFCPRCGTPVVDRCQSCLAPVGPDARFCFKCGTALATTVTE